MKSLISTLTAILALMAAAPASLAQGTAEVFYSDPYEGFNEETFMDMEFEPNIATPMVPDAEKAAVRRFMAREAQKLKGRFTVDLTRDDEVILVTVPASTLFLPNDTLLMEGAEAVFGPLLHLMADAAEYKVVAAVHTDDTGNDLYRERLSTARLNSVYDLFLDLIDAGKINPDIVIIPYAMGADDPVTDNDTWRHRAENRRLELYFIPGPAMIERAHRETASVKTDKKKKK